MSPVPIGRSDAARKAGERQRAAEQRGSLTYQGGYMIRFSREPGITKKGVLEKRNFYFQLPPLEEVRYASAAEHTDYNVLSGDQLSRPSARQLMQVSFRCVFLDYTPGFATFDLSHAQLDDPLEWIITLRRIQRSMTPFHVCMGNTQLTNRWEVDGPYTLRQFDVVEQAGEPDARYCDIALSAFNPAELDVREKGDKIITVYRDGRVRPLTGIQKPPTLAKISRRVYGTNKHADAIAKASGHKGWAANRDLRQLVRKKRGREFIKLKCPPKKSERLKKLTR